MSDLLWYQYALIAVAFCWSGFVRSGLGFGGAVLSLPFLLLIANQPLVYLPLIAVQLLFFSSLTVFFSNRNHEKLSTTTSTSTIDWHYLKKALGIMIIPKLIGVFGLITLPAALMSGIIFSIVAVYSLSYILQKPFKSNSKTLDVIFLMLGGYVSGASLIGAPLIILVFAAHVKKHQLRDTLFTLWFILVAIKLAAFVYSDIDLQLIHQLWLLPCAGVGHLIGLRFHQKLLAAETGKFYQILGSVLLIVSCLGVNVRLHHS
jgi:uncharacterized protein